MGAWNVFTTYHTDLPDSPLPSPGLINNCSLTLYTHYVHVYAFTRTTKLGKCCYVLGKDVKDTPNDVELFYSTMCKMTLALVGKPAPLSPDEPDILTVRPGSPQQTTHLPYHYRSATLRQEIRNMLHFDFLNFFVHDN